MRSEYISTRAMLDNYTDPEGSTKRNKGRFEIKSGFRSGLSKYDASKHTIIAGEDCKYDPQNCSGVPLDFDVENSVVYVEGTDSHTILIGSTGSKKSRLVVIPTVRILSSDDENMVICDPKGEIYRRTSGFLYERGYNVHMINLREPQKGDGWNILEIPYQFYCDGDIDKACELINDMTINLMPIQAKDPYWDYSARDVLFGLILLLFNICMEKGIGSKLANMHGVLMLREEIFSSTDHDIIQQKILWKYAERNELIRMRLIGSVIAPEKTLSCIISTFDQHMSCFSLQPKVISMLEKSTFEVNDFGFGRNAVYLIMPDEKTTFHKLITVFLKQIYEVMIDNAFNQTKDNRFPVRINYILDEFSSLPTISDFPQMIAASRSRNIRFLLVVQSKHQLRQRYGEETDTIMANCMNWIFLTSRELEVLREISELSGTTDNNRTPLISVSRLQHLNKEKGECVVFNGRKLPYISMIPDIDFYDGKRYNTMKMTERSKMDYSEYSSGYFEKIVSAHSIDDNMDVYKGLEEEFNQLYSSLNVTDNDSSDGQE